MNGVIMNGVIMNGEGPESPAHAPLDIRGRHAEADRGPDPDLRPVDGAGGPSGLSHP